jgi:hypothetical protein
VGAINGNLTEIEAADLTWQLNQLHGRGATVNVEREFLLQLDPERPLAGQPALLDLDQGRWLEWPAEVGDWNERRLGQWVDESGADLLIAGLQSAPRLGVIAMSLAPADASSWTNPPPRIGVLELIAQADTNWCGAPTNTVSDLGEDCRVMNLDCPLPATYAFRTAAGAAGLLQITAFTNNPPGVKIRYKLVQDGSAPALPTAYAETWSPTLLPGEKPNLTRIYQEAKALTEQGRYEAALQHYIWYHNHALEYEPSLVGVRLSFVLADWIALGRVYPKAQQALQEIREAKVHALIEGLGDVQLFMDVKSINQCLGDDEATYALFKSIERRDVAFARQCSWSAMDAMLSHGEFAACYGYLGDPQQRFDLIRRIWESGKARVEQISESGRERFAQSVDRKFIEDTRQLIEILMAVNRKAEAEKIRDQAVAALTVPEIAAAVSDAEAKLRAKQTGN